MGEIFLDPAPGYQVTLLGFSLGAWLNEDRTTRVTVRGGNGTVLYSSGEITIDGQISSPFGPFGTRSDGFRIQFGPDAFNVGIDNIAFEVTRGGVVPERATWALMIGGFGAAGAMLRRRRALAA